MPVAHAEGRFVLQKEEEEESLQKLIKNDQLVFRYCDEKGEYANGRYPANPNGSFYDIAGICDPSGTVFGLMPHPERACEALLGGEDGRLLFESMLEAAG